MCGICGIYNYENGKKVDISIIKRMAATLKHRGPDQEGYFSDEVIGLGHRRLNIIDLVTGDQPISNEDNTVQVILNGEIYNYKELREGLRAQGHIFKTESDTEVLVHLYEEYGEEFVCSLEGMFAIALWDAKSRSLFVYRDRIGQKPLYYFNKNGAFAFASEIKALLQYPECKPEIDRSTVFNYTILSYCPPPRTIIQGINKLLPASYLKITLQGIVSKRYWDLASNNKTKLSFIDIKTKLRDIVGNAVKKRLCSDVPLGAFLSGGLDSSIIVALMAQLMNNKVKTFSIGFNNSDYDELKFARILAKRYNTDHYEEIVTPDVSDILNDYIYHLDQPFADSSSIPTFYLAKMTRKYVTVALNGDGGDENFAGYPRYKAMFILALMRKYRLPYRTVMRFMSYFTNLIPDNVSAKSRFNNLKKLVASAKEDRPLLEIYNQWFCHFDPKQASLLIDSNESHNSFDYLQQNSQRYSHCPIDENVILTDIATYLPNDLLHKIDSMTMAYSLEARSPFLDHHVMEFCTTIPLHYKLSLFDSKIVLKDAFSDIVPRSIRRRRKMGFGVPISSWLRTEFKGLLCDTLNDRMYDRGIFNTSVIKTYVSEHLSGSVNHAYRLWNLMIFELWCRKYLDNEKL